MKIMIRCITDEMLEDVYEIHKEKLGEGYLNYEYFKELRDKEELMIAVDNGEVLGYLIYELTTERAFFESKKIFVESSSVPALCFLTMAVKYEKEGIGTFLIKSCMELYENQISVMYSPVWKSVNGTNADRLFTKLGFTPCYEKEDYWYEESIGVDNFCPVCGSPCVCSLVIYKRDFKRKGVLELRGFNYFFNAYGDDAKILYQIFGYKLSGKRKFRCSFEQKAKENVIKRLEELHINYRIYLYNNLIDKGEFLDNQYDRFLKEYNDTNNKITKYDVVEGLINGYDAYTGEVIKGISEETVAYLEEILSKLVVEKENPNAFKKWSGAEIENLKREFLSGMTIVVIAKKHGRSTKAIRKKLVELRLVEKVEIPKRWNEVDEEELKDEFLAGIKISKIAKMHGRTSNAIKIRLKKMGLL